MATETIKKPMLDEEASQSLARVVIAWLGAVLMFAFHKDQLGFLQSFQSLESAIIFSYGLASIPWLLWVRKTPGRFTWRRYITIFSDLGFTTLGLHLSGANAPFLYPIYLWVIVGNGLRFGTRALLVAMCTGAVGFSLLLKFNAFWQANQDIGYGLLAGVIVLPLFYLKVLNRTHQLNVRLEEELEKSKSAEKAKGDFLANMSHEIRTPMNGVLGMVEVLSDTNLETEQRDYLDIIRRSANSLLNILNDILDYSKIASGKMEMESVPLDLSVTLQDVVQLLRPTAEDKGVFLKFDYPENQRRAFTGDPTRIRQIVFNLVGNALKFTEKGGVSIVCQCSEFEERHNVSIEIRDTGIGIPEDRLDAIFEQFEQAEQGTTRKFGGTGLGLAICRQLSKLMGGEVVVHSQLGKGTTFIVNLRLEPCAQEMITRKKVLALPDYGLKALVAEDNQVNQLVVRKLLKKVGIAIEIANNGQEAVDMLAAGTYDLIFMDVRMPIMNGMEATMAIRTGELVQKDIPIVALTADASAEDAKNCLLAGMNAHLRKPLKLEELISAVDDLNIKPGSPELPTVCLAPH